MHTNVCYPEAVEITRFLFPVCHCSLAHNFGGSFQDLFHPGNKRAELILRGRTAPLGSSYSRQAEP